MKDSVVVGPPSSGTFLKRMSKKIILRLNSGNRNRHNFFMLAILTLKKTATDSVNHADSGDINILVQFPGNSILKFWVKFWNCVVGTDMREIAWVAPICVSFPKSTNEYIFLH